MWYLAEILTAERRQPGRRMYRCESCNVLFHAADAEEAHRKALAWGQDHVADTNGQVELLGVAHLSSIGDQLGEGVDICGRFFRKRDVWDRVDELIPPPERLGAARWEQNQDTPIGEMVDKEQVEALRRLL
jgi:hypothetical protein